MLQTGFARTFADASLSVWLWTPSSVRDLSARGFRRLPRHGLSVRPSRPSCKKRLTHLYTHGRLRSTVVAIWEMGITSASCKIIRPRLVRPAGIVVERCHARRAWHSAPLSLIVSTVCCSRAIAIPLASKSYHRNIPAFQSGMMRSYSTNNNEEKSYIVLDCN